MIFQPINSAKDETSFARDPDGDGTEKIVKEVCVGVGVHVIHPHICSG